MVTDELLPPGGWLAGTKLATASLDLLPSESAMFCGGKVVSTGVPEELTGTSSPLVELSRRSSGIGSFLGVDVEEETVRKRSRQRRCRHTCGLSWTVEVNRDMVGRGGVTHITLTHTQRKSAHTHAHTQYRQGIR